MKKTMCSEQKVSVFEKRISETLGTIVANQETTGILVYQVAESFSPADVCAKLPSGAIVHMIFIHGR